MISMRIPGEFRYWDHVADKRVQRARKAWRALFRFDPQPDDDYVHAFANAYYDADPVAEAFVDEVYFQRGSAEGRRMLDQAIEDGIDAVPDAPESIKKRSAGTTGFSPMPLSVS